MAHGDLGVVKAEVFIGKDDGSVDRFRDGVDVDLAIDMLGSHDVDIGSGRSPGIGVEGPLLDERTKDEVVVVVAADCGVADLVEVDAHALDDGLEVGENVRVKRRTYAGVVAALVVGRVGEQFGFFEIADLL